MGRRQDGSEFPVEVSLSPLLFGDDTLVIAVLRDVTERRRLAAAERALHAVHERQQALLQVVLDELPGGVYLVRGPDAELVLANRAATEVWGARWPIGQSMAAFLEVSGVRYEAPTGQSLTLDELVTLQIVRGGAPLRHVREVVRRPDGHRLAVLVSAVALDAAVLAISGDEVAAPGEQSEQSEQSEQLEQSEQSEQSEQLALVLLQDLSVVQAAEQVKDEFISLATMSCAPRSRRFRGLRVCCGCRRRWGMERTWQTGSRKRWRRSSARVGGSMRWWMICWRRRASRRIGCSCGWPHWTW